MPLSALRQAIPAGVALLAASALALAPVSEKFVKKQAQASPPAQDDLIVPGWRMGPVHLGMDAATLHKAVGPPGPASGGNISNNFVYQFKDRHGVGMSAWLVDDRVIQIDISSIPTEISSAHQWFETRTVYSTAERISLASASIDVAVRLGKPKRSVDEGQNPVYHLCYANGLSVSIERNRQVVIGLTVRRAGECP